MTNREYMIAVLSDEHYDPWDDGGASGESMIHYNIGCPYLGYDKRGHCIKNMRAPERELCVACKTEWLEAEVDT